MALVVVLFALLLLTGLGLAFTAQSGVEYQISENYVSHQQALAIADAGLNIVKKSIQQADFSTLLTQQTSVPAYSAGDQPVAGTSESRNAIATRAARNVDFDHPPTQSDAYQATGILTPATGQTFADGRYFAKLTNNTFGDATSVFGKDTDPLVDTDSTVLVRVTGIQPSPANEAIPGTNTTRNSVAVIEAMLRRDAAFDLGSPLTINGPAADATFNGNKFYVDGHNHNGMTREQIEAEHTENLEGAGPGMAAVYDNPSGGDGVPVASALYDLLSGNTSDNVVGSPGIHVDATPSVADITGVLRTSDNPDSKQILNPNFVGKFVAALARFADPYYPGSQHFSGGVVEFGTLAQPKITYVNGDLDISGSGSGAGILVVRGELDIGGSFEYDGIILVVGAGAINLHGSNEGVIGGMYVQNLTQDASGNYVSGMATIRLNGNSDFYFSGDMIRMALRLLPLKLLEWREITPDIS
jgi:hypothetical protein